jgi:hypothetical protein
MCASEHDAGDKREHAGKQHNVDDELDHHTPPSLRPEIPLDAIPAWWRHSGEDCRICGQPWPLLSSCVLEDTVRKSFDAFGGIARVPVELPGSLLR